MDILGTEVMFYAHSSSDIYYFLIEVKIVIITAGTSNPFMSNILGSTYPILTLKL